MDRKNDKVLDLINELALLNRWSAGMISSLYLTSDEQAVRDQSGLLSQEMQFIAKSFKDVRKAWTALQIETSLEIADTTGEYVPIEGTITKEQLGECPHDSVVADGNCLYCTSCAQYLRSHLVGNR